MTRQETVERVFKERKGTWFRANVLQKVMNERFGSPIYKPELDALRSAGWGIQHRYVREFDYTGFEYLFP